MVFQGGGSTSSFEKRCELNTRAALITAALLALIALALVFTGCPNAAASKEPQPPASADKTYTVGGGELYDEKDRRRKEQDCRAQR